MMKELFLVIFFCVLWAQSAVAEDIVVRAGEHEDFTRLVMQLPENTGWELEQSYGEANVTINQNDFSFDISQTFAIIPRTRLQSLSVDGTELSLQLACDCAVSAFFESPNYLVLDILDGDTLQLPESAERAAVNESVVPKSEFSTGELLWGSALNLSIERIPEPDVIEHPIAATDDPTSPEIESDIVEDTRERLLTEFAEAISRGIVEQVVLEPINQLTDVSPTEEIEVYDSSSEPPIPVSPKTHVRITSSRDIPKSGQLDELKHITADVSVCTLSPKIELASWINDEAFTIHLARSNENLFDELGRLDRSEVLKRAKLYLYFGFGAEALRELQSIPDAENRFPELFDLAHIMEHGYISNPRSLHRYAGCDSNLALWGVLAPKEFSPTQIVNVPAALRALEELPAHLRGFLGQELSKRFIKLGSLESAGLAMRSGSRAQLEEKPSIAEAEITRFKGDEIGSAVLMREVAATNTPDAPEAVIALVENHIASSESVPAELALLVEAFAFEYRGSQIGVDLLKTHAKASASSSQFDKSFSALGELRKLNNQPAIIEATSHLLNMLTLAENPLIFLENILNRRKELENNLENRSILAAAERLVQLGFSNEAHSWLTLLPISFETNEKRLISARSHLQQGNATDSLDDLEGMAGEEVDLLRAEALSQVGEQVGARQYFSAAQRPDLARTAGWLADNWQDYIDDSDNTFGEVLAAATELISPIETDDFMLEKTEKAIVSAQATRTTLTTLLNQLALEE